MLDSYKTIDTKNEGLYKEKGSKFLSFAFPVYTETEIQNILLNYHKEFHDARHQCYAYRMGLKGEIYKAFDDNEPTYTAGKPILGQIDAFGLTNILVVVVRYFGGTLLGKGGLINAYKSAAFDALSKSKIIEKTVNDYFNINCQYEEVSKVLKVLKDMGISPEKQIFNMNCELQVGIRKSQAQSVLKKIEIYNSVEVKYLHTL